MGIGVAFCGAALSMCVRRVRVDGWGCWSMSGILIPRGVPVGRGTVFNRTQKNKNKIIMNNPGTTLEQQWNNPIRRVSRYNDPVKML